MYVDCIVKTNLSFFILQALLHTYFFTEPLPAHHSDLPLPHRSTKRVRRAHQAHEYSVDLPLEDILVSPMVLRPHMQKHV